MFIDIFQKNFFMKYRVRNNFVNDAKKILQMFTVIPTFRMPSNQRFPLLWTEAKLQNYPPIR